MVVVCNNPVVVGFIEVHHKITEPQFIIYSRSFSFLSYHFCQFLPWTPPLLSNNNKRQHLNDDSVCYCWYTGHHQHHSRRNGRRNHQRPEVEMKKSDHHKVRIMSRNQQNESAHRQTNFKYKTFTLEMLVGLLLIVFKTSPGWQQWTTTLAFQEQYLFSEW